MDVMLREFGRYCADHHRTKVFQIAIEEQVRPGDVVADLGTGFGLLALMAVRCGARRVYAIEQSEHVELARAIAFDNGLNDRITFLKGNSASIQLPERVDVLVSEILGQFGLEEYIVEYLHDAALRFLKPGGRLIPQNLRLFVTPYEMLELRQRFLRMYGSPWDNVSGFNLCRLQTAVLHNNLAPYLVESIDGNDQTLGPRTPIASFDFHRDSVGTFLSRFECQIDRDGILDGFVGTFEAVLSQSSILSTGPSEPETHWKQVVFPVFPARPVSRGDRVALVLGYVGNSKWHYELLNSPDSNGQLHVL